MLTVIWLSEGVGSWMRWGQRILHIIFSLNSINKACYGIAVWMMTVWLIVVISVGQNTWKTLESCCNRFILSILEKIRLSCFSNYFKRNLVSSHTWEELRERNWALGKDDAQIVINWDFFHSLCTITSLFHLLWSELSVFHLVIKYFSTWYTCLGKWDVVVHNSEIQPQIAATWLCLGVFLLLNSSYVS